MKAFLKALLLILIIPYLGLAAICGAIAIDFHYPQAFMSIPFVSTSLIIACLILSLYVCRRVH